MARSNDEITDILRKIFTAIAAKEGKITFTIDRTKKYLDETKEHPSKILESLVRRRLFKDSLVCLSAIVFTAVLYCSWS